MTIEIAQDWFNNNISDQTGYSLDSENEIFTKTILEDDLNFEFSTDTDGEFSIEIFQSFCSFWIFRYHSESYCSCYIYWIRYQWHNFDQVRLKFDRLFKEAWCCLF